jgi:hypothetical protein
MAPERAIPCSGVPDFRALRSTLMVRVDFYVYGFDDMKGGETVLLGDRDGCLESSEVTKS